RRGDAWYLNSLEPPPDFTPIAAGFDPLQDLITEAHASGIEVHAFVIMSAIWNKNPNFAPSPTLGPPTNPNHVFNLHGGYDRATQKIVPGPNNWLTRSLIPDGTAGISFQGHRVGAEFWLDFGHPDAAAYTVDVLMHLVRNYDIDGLHLDRIRYPEIGIGGQTRLTGANIGYNQTSIERFQRANGIAIGSAPPPPGDSSWAQWRRDQVTNVVRRIYLNAIALKPQIKISAALIAFGGAPPPTGDWTTSNVAEAYWRVYQDWRAWTEEGILDIAIPMNYKREHLAAQQTQFNQWLDWTRTHKYDRAALMGQGAFVNGIEGTLRQVRRSLESDAEGNKLDGVVFFSMATSNVRTTTNGTTPATTPYSIPPHQVTEQRPFAEFASGLVTGKSVDGLTLYEDPIANPLAVFSYPVPVPVHPWKANPQVGHLKGFVKNEAGVVVDTGAIRIERQDTEPPAAGRTSVANATDGGGFYGGVDLVPGTYRVTVTPVGAAPFTSCPATVTAGVVTTLDVTIDHDAPTATLTA
ncbi:MAG TPA: family 10 glycosylhydrolase, partial [Vicinamibacterales bacterium]|nr:family 10 glycosylhydrolase [Vicinamibacterales bacterium]